MYVFISSPSPSCCHPPRAGHFRQLGGAPITLGGIAAKTRSNSSNHKLTNSLSYEIVENKRATGSPFAFKPQINPMIGPASIELVTLGARFPPCMKFIPDVPPTMPISCANATSTTPSASQICTIEDVCGFSGFGRTATGATKEPNQWFRFITPIFLHAGIIHFLLNMFAQWVLSGLVEKEMGSVGFFILYFASGIFGNVLGTFTALNGLANLQ